MKTIGVKLDKDRARRLASEAEARGLTLSGAVAAVLAEPGGEIWKTPA